MQTVRLLETIRISNGTAENLPLHQARLERAQLAIFGRTTGIDLRAFLDTLALPNNGVFKCRIEYDTHLRAFSLTPYTPRALGTLALLTDDTIEYPHKFADRKHLEALHAAAVQHGAEEVIIVKNGRITDTSFSNLAFFDGLTWWTPATPLLPGTQRARCLAEGLLHPADITPADLRYFRSLRLINAMWPFEQSPDIPIGHIIPRPSTN